MENKELTESKFIEEHEKNGVMMKKDIRRKRRNNQSENIINIDEDENLKNNGYY